MKDETNVDSSDPRRGAGAPSARPPHAPPRFCVADVQAVSGPDGDEAGQWCSYVLENGRSTITGQRRGSVQQVTEHATRYADELNARSSGQSTPGWAPRRRT
ncbi:MAG: hypothetical protein WCC36_10060 [Gammaproteobacteria bacterium]